MREYTYSEYHMGTEVTVSLVGDSEKQALKVSNEIFQRINTFEKIFSRFIQESELSRLNAGGRGVVSDEFLQVCLQSTALAKKTDDAFNPLIQVARLGYTKNFKDIENAIVGNGELYNTNYNEISINEQTKEIILAEGQQLDFGGFLKGYIAEKLMTDVLSVRRLFTGAIINLGGDLCTWGYDAFHKPFTFLIYNPVTRTEIPMTLLNTCLATSGTYHRVWNTQDGSRHHIVDSTTKQNPHTEIVSASVVHPNGGIAEAYTKLFLTRGVEASLRIIGTDGYHYVLIASSGAVISNKL